MASPQSENKYINARLKIISLNVRGLRNKKKRRTLFRKFKSDKYDIICLQETYLSKKDIYDIRNEWGINFHLAEGTNNSKGLITLFSKYIDFSNIECIHASERCLISNITIDGTLFAIVNIYAPCISTEKIEFLNFIKLNINQLCTDLSNQLILLGDFNIVIDNKLDIISGEYHSANIVKRFSNLINDLLLVDVWRSMHGNRKEFSWSKNTPYTARRIDYIFTSEYLIPFCKSSDISYLGFSDHKAISIYFDFSSFKRGPSTYKFNVTLLKNKTFINEVIKEIDRINSLDFDPHLRWDYIKVIIKDKGMAFGREIARSKRNEKQNLIREIKNLESVLSNHPNDEESIKKLSTLKTSFELFEINEAEGARIRSGQKWAQDGEKCTKYFLNLEKHRSNCNTLIYSN